MALLGWLSVKSSGLYFPVYEEGTFEYSEDVERKALKSSSVFLGTDNELYIPDDYSITTLGRIRPFNYELLMSLCPNIGWIKDGRVVWGVSVGYKDSDSTIFYGVPGSLGSGQEAYEIEPTFSSYTDRLNEWLNGYLFIEKLDSGSERANYGDIQIFMYRHHPTLPTKVASLGRPWSGVLGDYVFISDYELYEDAEEAKKAAGINSNPYTPSIGPGSGGTGGFPSWTGGGGGNFGVVDGTPESSDPIAPFLPGIGTPSGSVEGLVSNSGLFVHYAMNGTSLEILGDWLWANELGLAIAKEFISLLYGSPIESAISLMSYPFDIRTLRGVQINSQEVHWGGHASGVTAPAITNPYATIDWGTIQLTEFWGNFLDYAPHTKLELYLPWCTGFVPIDPNECLPGTLRVVTNIELAKGTCLHNVIGNDGRVIATHAGTCGKQLPLTALDTSGKALAFVTSAVAGATVGGAAIAGAMGGAMYPGSQPITLHSPYDPNKHRYLMMDKSPSISSISEGAKMGASMFGRAAKKPAVMAASAGLRAQVSVSRNGSFTGSTAGLGVQFPYLIISRPTQSVPAQYGHHYGYPSNIYTPLANLRGYTEVGEIHLSGFLCTEEELEEIDSILKGGVIL